MDAQDFKCLVEIVGLIESIFTILAVIIGGLWVYYNFFQGRIYRPRFDIHLAGKFFEQNDCINIQVTSILKNVGLSKVNITREGTAICAYSYQVPDDVTDIEKVYWGEPIGAFPVFENHRWVESRETIEDNILLSVKKENNQVFRFQLRVVARKISWTSDEILFPKARTSLKEIKS